MLVLIIALLGLTVCTTAAEVSTKAMRAHRRMAPFGNVAVVDGSSSSGSVELAKHEQSRGPIEAFREEIIDIVEGFMVAESREEAVEHALDVMERNKAVFGVAAGVFVAKNVLFSPKSAEKLARDVGKEMRAAEITKWGRRL